MDVISGELAMYATDGCGGFGEMWLIDSRHEDEFPHSLRG